MQITVDLRGVFRAVTNGVLNVATGQWVRLATDVIEGSNAIGVEATPTDLAEILIKRACSYAIFELIEDSVDLLLQYQLDEDACRSIETSLVARNISIEDAFFERPEDMALIPEVRGALELWLTRNGVPVADANAIGAGFSSYFVFALANEWRNRRTSYEQMLSAVKTPFSEASVRSQMWTCYAAWLDRQLDQRMLGESFSLRTLYVPLRAYYEVAHPAGHHDEESAGRWSMLSPPRRRRVVDLLESLDRWMQAEDQHDAIRVISGGPGSGKSSFARIYTAKLSREGETRAVYVPLHQFNVTATLRDALDEFCRNHEFLREGLLDPKSGETRILLVFDGLDELSQQGSAGAELACRFVREIEKTVSQRNQVELRVQVLISGRPVVIQANDHEFRREGQILHLLPYYVPATERIYDDLDSLLKTDQRKLWWSQYDKLKGRPASTIPEVLRREDLSEITSQPLLNYLVALIHDRGQLDFSRAIDLNQIYSDLLQEVYKRGYEGRPTESIRGMSYEQFARVLEEIGIAAWHGDGRTTTVRAIRERCEGSGVDRHLAIFQEGAESGITRLLIAFYFRQHGLQDHGERTFEFTHKSFGEYLAARRMVRAVFRVVDELTDRDSDPDEGWDHRQSLIHWAGIFGPADLDPDLLRFVEAALRHRDRERLRQAHHKLILLLELVLQGGFPMEKVNGVPTFAQQVEHAHRAEVALVVMLRVTASITESPSKIMWPDDTSAAEWLSRLQPYRLDSQPSVALANLDWFDFSERTLYVRDLCNAHLRHASFARARLDSSNLQGAQLRHASFESCSLCEANLQNADLRGATLKGVIALGADFRGANLTGTNLQGAVLIGANLRDAILVGADLRGAELEGAMLENADLAGANLEGSDWESSVWKGAKLGGANLKGTYDDAYVDAVYSDASEVDEEDREPS